MKFIFLIFLFFAFPILSKAQYNFKIKVVNIESGEVLPGVVIKVENAQLNETTDNDGIATLTNLKKKKSELLLTHIGYKPKSTVVFYNLMDTSIFKIIALEKDTSILEEVVVSTTRSSRNIEIIPTRIEAITKEELEEKSSMKPGDIRMLLNESTGITTQQTSAVSGNANIRIQGLDGRYTLLLKDGMPLFNAFSGGLSIMQTPPLDLKQVEIIKGSASTLYGGGAIAGLVNLISKTPTEQKEFTSLLNLNSGKGLDLSGFYSKRNKVIGTTIFASFNHNDAYDPYKLGLSIIPQFDRFTVNPKLFIYPNNKLKIVFGINLTTENRLGGDMNVLNNRSDIVHKYFERNISFRLSTTNSIDYKIDSNRKLQFKNMVGIFNRKFETTYNSFNGQQISNYFEISYVQNTKKQDFVIGINSNNDIFKPLDTTKFNYNLNTIGSFVQYTYKPFNSLIVESGLRLDYNKPYSLDNTNGLFLLPRINVLFTYNKNWSSRLGCGLGYKMPTPFNDESDKIGYQNLPIIDVNKMFAERSYGIHYDINYKIKQDEFLFSINQLFFYTSINSPILLTKNAFINANGYLDSKGSETNARISFDELNFYLGYTFAEVVKHYNSTNIIQALSPKHRINFDITYEVENNYRFGFEAFYTSTQKIDNGQTGKDFLILGFLLEKVWKRCTYFLNVENVTDQSQVKWDLIYNGSITNPIFKDIYAPLDGRIINTGVKIKF